MMTAVDNDVTNDDQLSYVTSTRDHMTMNLVLRKTRVRLELEKNENIPEGLSHYTTNNGKLTRWTSDTEEV